MVSVRIGSRGGTKSPVFRHPQLTSFTLESSGDKTLLDRLRLVPGPTTNLHLLERWELRDEFIQVGDCLSADIGGVAKYARLHEGGFVA